MPTDSETLILFKLVHIIEGNLLFIACGVSGKSVFASSSVAKLVTEKLTKPLNIVALTLNYWRFLEELEEFSMLVSTKDP